jgi:hypothetical protein
MTQAASKPLKFQVGSRSVALKYFFESLASRLRTIPKPIIDSSATHTLDPIAPLLQRRHQSHHMISLHFDAAIFHRTA